MLKKIDPTKTSAWQKLKKHFREIEGLHMRDLFVKEPNRGERLSVRFQDILVDYSKNRITEETLGLLFALAREVDLADAVEKMFTGDRINETENRPVLHVALRNRANSPIYVDGQGCHAAGERGPGEDEGIFR